MPASSIRIGKVRGEDGRGVIAGGTAGQALVKNTSTDFDTTWRSIPLSVNNVTPDQSGDITINTGAMTVNGVSPVNGNVTVDTGVMTVNSQTPVDGDIVVDTGVMTINSSSPVDGNVDIDTGVMNMAYSSSTKKITKTIGSTTTDVVSAETLKEDMSLDNVENKSSATIRGEITSANVTNALGYTPLDDSSVITNAQIDALFE